MLPPTSAMPALIGAIRAWYVAATATHPRLARTIEQCCAHIDALDPTQIYPREPQAAAVCCWLETAIDAAAEQPTQPVAAALRPLAPLLRWEQTYAARPELAAFFANYAYADLVGPRGLVFSADLTLGVLLLGPHTLYPSHAHPAVELYTVLSGTACWQQGHEPWAEQPPGSCLLHPSWQPHATQTHTEPLLALYAWLGTLDVPAAFVHSA
jgi:mannose-6-phosphate isomerase-like protein (cupin superfamily)